MHPLSAFWHKICEPLDGYLWHRDITHHLARPALRNQILASGASVLAGALCYNFLPWLFWFGAGVACMTWIFWSWAKFFLTSDLGSFSSAFLGAILLRFFLRLIILAVLLYLALAVCQASAPAMAAGMIAGSLLGLTTYAVKLAGSQPSK